MLGICLHGSGVYELPYLDFGKVVSFFTNVFAGCKNLQSAPEMNVDNVTSFEGTFINCSNMINFPVINAPNVQGFYTCFGGCTNLSNDALNNIMYMLSTSNVTNSQRKKLSYIGLSSSQIATCQTLSNYSLITAKGWSAT